MVRRTGDWIMVLVEVEGASALGRTENNFDAGEVSETRILRVQSSCQWERIF